MKDHEKVDVEIPHVLVSDVKEFFIPGLDESKFLVLHLKDYRIISLRSIIPSDSFLLLSATALALMSSHSC